MTKKKSDGSFTSLRIIGEKAQRLLARAKEELRRRGAENTRTAPPPPQAPVDMVVSFSIASIAKATLTVIAIVVGVLMLYFIKDKIVLLLLAIFIAIIIDPGVQAMKRAGIPRGLGILIHYFIALFLFLFLVVSLIPIIADQLQNIAFSLNQQVNLFLANPRIALPLISDRVNVQMTIFLQNTLQQLSIQHLTDVLRQFGQNLSTAAQGSLAFAAFLAGSVFDFFVNMIVVLVLAFFIQLEKEKLVNWARGFLPWSFRSYVDDKSEVIHWKLAQWARGQLILCVSIGVLVFFALVILRMPYALTLAILAAFTEFIPVIGPFIAMIPAVLIAITQQGFFWGLIVGAVYYVVQWCENNLLVPLIMKRAVGLSPIAIMFAMMVAVSFPSVIHPVLGVILAIPTTTVIALFLEDWRAARREKLGAAV
ncbi:AI-2E family transporter [Candidatus Peregrinibacteria bacterium]|nr:AI-2E family transporter [Candidatus Peregrinibacteria bacterium]